MGLISTVSDGVGSISAGARAGQILQVNDAGVLFLGTNHPVGQIGGHYSVHENGAAGGLLGVGLNEWFSGGSGAGAVRTPLTTEAGWFNGSGSIETGTTSTGSFSLGSNPSVQFSSTSGTWFFELTFSLPVLSDVTNTYTLQTGFALGNPLTAGAALKYTHSVNGGRFQFTTGSGGVTTSVDSGVALVAGNYYHLRIELINNTSANFSLITTFNGGTWSDTGVWGSPLATISTNIPNGSADRLFSGINLTKSAGTTSVKLKYGYLTMNRIPPLVRVETSNFVAEGALSGGDCIGQSLGAKGNTLGIARGGFPGWFPPQRMGHPFQFLAFGRPGFVLANPHDFGYTLSGSPGGVQAAECVDNSLWGTTALINNFSATGAAAFCTAIALKLDATVNPLFFETVISPTVLSTGGAPFNIRAGFVDSVTVAPSNGIYVELDGSVSTLIQCKVMVGGVVTTVATGITITTLINYFIRIIATSTSISFYVAVDDTTALTTPIAVITTNIPIGVAMAAANICRSTGSVALAKVRTGPVLAFSRSTT